MIRHIRREQIVEKLNAFLQSEFGTPAGDHVAILEVGSTEEYDRMHIQNAIQCSEQDALYRARERLPDLGQEIIIYGCHSERNAVENVAGKLQSLGYSNVYVFTGGKEDWINHGLPVESSAPPQPLAHVG